jgi:hypothetical protein
VKAGHGIHGRTDKKNPWISELSGFLRTINKIDSVSSVALSKQVSYRIEPEALRILAPQRGLIAIERPNT